MPSRSAKSRSEAMTGRWRCGSWGRGLADRGFRSDRAPHDGLHLFRRQILDSDAVAVFDDFGNPLAVAMSVVALVAENADRAGFFHQRRQLVEFLPGPRVLQMRR